MDDRYDINSRFDLMRDSQARRINAVVMADSELEFGSYYGRLNVFESPTETLSMRSLFVGPRLFILIVGTKGRLSAQSPTLKAANRKRIDDFFNSFAITRVPEAKSVPVELPDDFGVSVTNGTFTSAFFGSRMSLPAGWTSLEKGDSDLLLEMGKDELKRTQPGLADHITEKTARVHAAFSRSQPSQGVPDAFMLVLAERAPYPNFLPSALASTYEKLYVDRNEQVTKPPSSVRINGIEFSMVETFNKGSKLHHRLFFANRNGIAFEVSMIYLRPDALPSMLAALETLRFGPESK
jgi:hypothetical protein